MSPPYILNCLTISGENRQACKSTYITLRNNYVPPYSSQKELAKDLWEAVDNHDVSEVRSLLGRGADPNHQLYWSDEWGYKDPPLHHACYEGYLAIVKTLVTHGARTDKGGGRDNMTPLHNACRGGHKDMVEYLIQEVGCSAGK